MSWGKENSAVDQLIMTSNKIRLLNSNFENSLRQ